MTVYVHFSNASMEYPYEDVKDVYTKGEMLCLAFKNGDICKFPLMHIFCVRSTYKEEE